MQRQTLVLKGARGAGTSLAELPVPAKYRWVPDGVPAEDPYNVAQLYAKLGESIRGGTPMSPGFDARSPAIACSMRLCALHRAE